MKVFKRADVAAKFRAKYERAPDEFKEIHGDERDADVAAIMVLAEILDERLGRIEKQLRRLNVRMRKTNRRARRS